MTSAAAQQGTEEIRRGIERQIVISLAGQAAEKRALRADHDGGACGLIESSSFPCTNLHMP